MMPITIAATSWAPQRKPVSKPNNEPTTASAITGNTKAKNGDIMANLTASNRYKPTKSIIAIGASNIFLNLYLTPLIPLSFKGEGEVVFKRGFASL